MVPRITTCTAPLHEERSDEAIQTASAGKVWIASRSPSSGPRFARTRLLAMTATYGLIEKFSGGPAFRNGSASLANSHSSDLVFLGSMISSTQNFSAERNGERSLFSRSWISLSLPALSSAASMSAR